MLRTLDTIAKRCIAYPIAIIGHGLTILASVLLHTAAWLLDIPIPEDDAYDDHDDWY